MKCHLTVFQGYSPVDVQRAFELEAKMRHLIISYIGIHLMNPEAFHCPEGFVIYLEMLYCLIMLAWFRKPAGHLEFVAILLSLSSFSTPLYGGTVESPYSITPSEIEVFLQDLVNRFEPEGDLELVLGPVVRDLACHDSLSKSEGLASSDSQWRGVIAGLEALVSNKHIIHMIIRMPEWDPKEATPTDMEDISLMGPLLSLNVFPRDWVCIDSKHRLKLMIHLCSHIIKLAVHPQDIFLWDGLSACRRCRICSE